MGQMPSGMYYQGGGYGGGIGAQGATSPGLSHLSQAGGGYPTSPGHSVGYSLPSNQQVTLVCNYNNIQEVFHRESSDSTTPLYGGGFRDPMQLGLSWMIYRIVHLIME